MLNVPLWRQIRRNNFTDWKNLLSFLEFDVNQNQQNVLTYSKFPLNLPRRLAEKIEKKNWNDPILRQFLPTVEELQSSPLFVLDPVADTTFRSKPKLLHKYHGRALLLCTGS